MKKIVMKYFSFLMYFSVLAVNAQESVNQFDKEGKKNGLWKGFFEDSNRLRYTGVFKNGVEVDTFKYFDNTKVNSLLATRIFSEKGTVAFTIFYDQNKNKVSEGKTVNRLKEETWNYYHKNSKQLMSVENYKNDILDGVRNVYFPTGAIAEEATYNKGLKVGIYKVYLTNGVVAEESYFKDGLYDGLAIFRGKDNNIVSKGFFKKNTKNGIWEFYENGKLIRTEKHPLKINFEKRKNIPKE